MLNYERTNRFRTPGTDERGRVRGTDKVMKLFLFR